MQYPQERTNDDVHRLTDALLSGQTSRRGFIQRAVVLGLSSAAIGSILAACGGETATTVPATIVPASAAPASAAPASTAPTAAAGGAATRTAAAPAASTGASSAPSASAAASGGPTKRGGGGTLKLLQWQAATILNPQLSSGTKDDLACTPVYEALLTFNIDGNAVPILAAEIPSRENGGVATDGKAVTFKLKQGVKWSDGKPFTADDVVFTWEYVTDKATAAVGSASYETVEKAEKIDDNTVKFTFSSPNPAWFRPAQVRVIPRHIFEADKGANAKSSPNNLKPVGTGPYKVTNFAPGDTVTYAINENYREANKPFFDQIQLKGGGDTASAARAVLQTGDYDYAWNLQLEDTILKQLETGGKGVAEFGPGGGVERIIYQFADPNKEVDGERASPSSKHPFLSDQKVRKAFTMGCNLESVVTALYGRGGIVSPNILNDPPQYRSANNKFEYNLDKANALLDEAGWKKGSQYRAKDDVDMAVVFQTSVNTIRQKTQQIIKDGWEKLGVRTELKGIDSAVFFSSDAGNPDTNSKFYADVEMFTGTPVIDPQTDMIRWHSKSIASKANTWSGRNYQRYSNPEYDQAWDAAQSELDPQKRAQLFIKMNDILIQGSVVVPVVDRKSVYGRSKTLQNINFTPWDTDYWNIANWTKQG